MTLRRIAAAATCAALLWALCPARADEPADPWKALDLATTHAGKVTIHYERRLAPKMAAIRKIIGRHVAEEEARFAKAQGLLGRADALIADVNRIVGASPNDQQKAKQREMLAFFLTKGFRLVRPGRKTILYLATRQTIKDHLRKGGKLPGFAYDKATDKVIYHFFHKATSGGAEGAKDVRIPLPVPAKDTEKDLRTMLGMLGRIQSVSYEGLALHELAEGAILGLRLRPAEPHFRWFSDGVANAIAIRLLEKHVGAAAAMQFAEAYDTVQCDVPPSQTNLLRWMGKAFAIEAPTAAEGRLHHARCCYATYEARRLIDAHGIDCIRKILDAACKQRPVNSQVLLAAVKSVTGEDIEKRFARYQDFKTPADGIRKHTAAFNAAMEKKDLESALWHALRAMELKKDIDLIGYTQCCLLLHRLGHEAAADGAIVKRIVLFERLGASGPTLAMKELFVQYALQCRNPRKAYAAAEHVLKDRPEFTPALAVRMHRLAATGEIDEAKKIARKILSLDTNEKSPQVRYAKRLLEAIATQPAN